jgi:hypothetical protein
MMWRISLVNMGIPIVSLLALAAQQSVGVTAIPVILAMPRHVLQVLVCGPAA